MWQICLGKPTLTEIYCANSPLSPNVVLLEYTGIKRNARDYSDPHFQGWSTYTLTARSTVASVPLT